MKKSIRISTLFNSLLVVLLCLSVSCSQKKVETEKAAAVEKPQTTESVKRQPAKVETNTISLNTLSENATTTSPTYTSQKDNIKSSLSSNSQKTSFKAKPIDIEDYISTEKKRREEYRKQRNEKRPHYYSEISFDKVYKEKHNPPELDLTIDISNKSLEEIRILRNEVYATKGFLFMNASVRGHFNQYEWYQPIYWEDTPIELTKEEQDFVNKCLIEENKRLSNNFITHDGYRMANLDNLVNRQQFENLSPILLQKLRQNNFARVANETQRLFSVYDKNQYGGIPNYVTTDCYQYILHVYFSKLLSDVENKQLSRILMELNYTLFNESLKLKELLPQDDTIQKALTRNLIITAVACNLLQENAILVPEEITEDYSEIFRLAKSGRGIGLNQLGDMYYDFTQLQPRGNYSDDDNSGAYFRSLKWLMTVPLNLNTEIGKMQAIQLAYILAEDQTVYEFCESFIGVINLFAGEGEDLSLLTLANIIQFDYKNRSLQQLLGENTSEELIDRLREKNKRRIVARSSLADNKGELPLFIIPSSYTIDAEVHQRLLQPVRNPYNNGHRLCPKGLDIFAAFGNNTAESILLDVYRENEKWTAFSDTLEVLKREMPSLLEKSQSSLYGKRMDLFLSLDKEHPNVPGFMKTPAYSLNQLNSALVGWTELAHEMVLYRKQAVCAEGGEGGGIPEPYVPAYVEPNLEFWKKSVELMDITQERLESIGYSINHAHEYIKGLGQGLLFYSWKELNSEPLTESELSSLDYIGGSLEYGLRTIKESFMNDIDKMPIVTDVATYSDENGEQFFLEEATGMAHEIYVVVEINGLLYLARGAVSTYYEFVQPGPTRLTNNMWRTKLANDNPPQPEWIKEIYIYCPTLVSSKGYSKVGKPVTYNYYW